MIESTLTSAAALALLATWRALPLLAVALAVDLVLGRRLAARHHACLWTFVAVRMLLPFSVAGPLSLHGPIDRWTFGPLEQEFSPLPSRTDRVASFDGAYLLYANVPQSADEWQPGQPLAATDFTVETAVIVTVLGLWLLVAGAAILRACVAHARFVLRLKHCQELTEAAVIDLVLRQCDELRIRRRPRLKEVPGLATPAVFGLLRATICLPPGLVERLEPRTFRWVLRHELAHLRRFDTWTLSLASIMRAIHWINPCAWLVVANLRARAEQAADELALRGASTTDAVAYGRLLLDFAEAVEPSRAAPVLGLVPFVSGRHLRHRVERLTRPIPQPGRPLRWLLGVALLLIAVTGMTDAQPPPAPQPEIRLAEVGQIGPILATADDEPPASLRSYDVAALLTKLRELDPDADVEQGLIRFVRFTARMPEIVEGQLVAEATEKQHRALTEELEAMARSGPWQIATELRILQIDLTLATPIEWKVAPIAAKQQTPSVRPVLFAQIDGKQLGELVRATERDRRSQLMLAPKVTTFNGQTASIMDLASRPFITGVVPADNGQWKPLVELINDGLKVTMRSVVTETDTVELSIDLKKSEIGEVRFANLPIRIEDGPRADKPLVTVQVPTVQIDSFQMTADLTAGESLLIAVPRLFDPRGGQNAAEASTTWYLYAVTPRMIADTDRL